MSKQRLQYLINKIDDYNTSYGTYPKSINNIGIPLDGNNHRESFCNMHETMLDGWGYCYYAYYDEFQKASGSLHAGGILGLIRHKITGYNYGTHPRYGEIDYQYLRSKYGYDFKIKNGARNSTYKK